MKYRRIFLLLLAYGALWFVCRSTVEYTVTVDPNGGELLGGELVQTVKIGKDAQMPELDNGRLELHWDASFENIRQDTVITAQWIKVPLEPEALEEYLRPRLLRIHAVLPEGETREGAGFFLDENGRVVTSFGLVAGASEITVEQTDGSVHPVLSLSEYSRGHDLAVLETGAKNDLWLEMTEGCRRGDILYAAGTSGKGLCSGELLKTGEHYGVMDCVKTDLTIGIPGSPLVDSCGDVVAFCSSLKEKGELAADAAMLADFSMDKEKTVEDFLAWYNTEKSRSYEVKDGDGYRPAMVRTYQMVTGAPCTHSLMGQARYEGYYLRFDGYIYEYFEPELAVYREYLRDSGYFLQQQESAGGETLYIYYSPLDQVELRLAVYEEKAELQISLVRLSAETDKEAS